MGPKPAKKRPHDAAHSKHGDFLFINVSGGAANAGSATGDTDQKVRSFVMSKIRRNRPWSTRSAPASEPHSAEARAACTGFAGAGKPAYGATMPARARVCARCRQRLALASQLCDKCSFATSLSRDAACNGRLGPFAVLPVEMDSKTEFLVDHFITHISPGAIPIDLNKRTMLYRDKIVQVAVAHPGILYGISYMSALHTFLQGKSTMLDILFYKSKAIEHASKRLSCPWTQIDDVSIFSVFGIAVLHETAVVPMMKARNEDLSLLMAEHETHLAGLKNMIQLRGGIEMIPSPWILCLMISWVRCRALATLEPLFVDVAPLEATFAPLPTGPAAPPSSHALIHRLATTLALPASLTTDFLAIATYTAYLSQWYSAPSGMDVTHVLSRGQLLQCRLLAYLAQPSQPPVASALALAFLFFVGRGLGRRTHPAPNYQLPVERLHAALLACPPRIWAAEPRLLLWVLVVGAFGAEHGALRRWFARQARAAAGALGLRSPERFMAALRGVLWLEARLDALALALWSEMGAADEPVDMELWERCVGEQVRVSREDDEDAEWRPHRAPAHAQLESSGAAWIGQLVTDFTRLSVGLERGRGAAPGSDGAR